MKKRKKWNSMKSIAMFLVMVLTFTQIPAVPAAAEDFTENMFQEVELFQDGSDADVVSEPVAEAAEAVSEPMEESAADVVPEAAEEATVDADISQEPEVFQDGAEAVSVELFSAGEMETSMPVLTSGEENKQYHLNYDYIGTIGNGAMLPNSTMTISTHLMDCTNDDDWEEVKGYTLEISSLGEEYDNEFQATVDGTDLVITSSDETGWFEITAKFWLNEEEIYTGMIYFGISKYMLTPETIVDENGDELNPEKKESIDLSKVGFALKEYRDGNLYPVEDTSKYRIEVAMGTEGDGNTWYDYDTEGWNLQEVSGQDLPIMTRTTENGTWFALTVMLKESDDSWNQVARRQYFFESLYEGGNGEDAGGEDDDEWHNDFSEAQSNYELWIDFADTIGNGAMLPNSQMTIVTDLRDKNNDYSEITDYKLEIVTQSKYGEATVSSDGKNLVMKSKDETGDGCCYVSVQIPDGNGGYQEVFKKDVPFSVSQYMLTPGALVDENGNELNPKKDESIDLSKVGFALQEYKDGQLSSVDASKYRIIVYVGEDEDGNVDYDYDTYGWDMEKVSEQDLPIMTRKTDSSTWFAVTVLWQESDGSWNQVARRNYFFDSLYEDGEDGENGEDGDTWREDDSEEKSNYALALEHQGTIGNGAMLPNSKMTIVTNLQDKTDGYSAITDYKLEIVEQSTYGEATVSSDGKSLVIESKDKIGDGNCYVSVQIPDGNGGYKEAFKKEIYFSVSRYMLTPGTFVDENGEKINPEVWESIDLSKIGIELQEYRDGQLYSIGDPESLKVVVWSKILENSGEKSEDYYDVNGWTLQEISGQDLPIMTRITHEPTWFIVTALEKSEDGTWHSLTSRDYYFDEVAKHAHTWGEWKVTKEATYTSKGVKTHSCTVCDAAETEEIACVTIPAPTLVSATETEGKTITFTWSAVSGIDGYEVYRKTAGANWTLLTDVTSDKTSYVDTNAIAGTEYIYTVQAYCNSNNGKIYGGYEENGKSATVAAVHEHSWSDWKVTKEATYTTKGLKTRSCTGCDAAETEEIACVAIQTPTLVSAAATAEKEITVTWTAVSGIDGYYVYRKVSGGKWTRLADLSADKVSYVDSKVTAGKEYIYTVKAYCNDGSTKIYGGYDSAGKSATAVAKAASPTLVSAKATAGNTLTFKWKAVSGIDGYRVYRKTVGGSYKKLADVSASKTSYVDTTAVAGVSYTYTVRAYNNLSGSILLGSYVAAGKTATAKAGIPTLVSAKATAENTITFTWKKVNGIDGYRVYRKTAGGSYKKLADVSASKKSYVDTTAVAGVSYTYTVRAYNNVNGSKLLGYYTAAGKTATAVAKAASPTLVSAKATAGNTITFTWKKVNGIDGYRVYRKTAGGSYKKLADVSAGKTSYVDTTAVAGVSYTYTVRAYNKLSGSTLWGSYIAAGKTATAKAGIPTLGNATVTAKSAIKFTWEKVSGIDGYRVYRKEAGGSYKKIADVSASKTSYVDKTAEAGKSYTYTVRAYNKVNGSKILGFYDKTGKTVTVK